MSNRIHKIQIRLTDDEFGVLEDQRNKCHMNLSVYVRAKLLNGDSIVYYDPALREDFQKLIYEINKIGTNINQIAASVNSKQFSTDDEITTIKQYLKLVSHHEIEIQKLIMGELQHGNNKTIKD